MIREWSRLRIPVFGGNGIGPGAVDKHCHVGLTSFLGYLPAFVTFRGENAPSASRLQASKERFHVVCAIGVLLRRAPSQASIEVSAPTLSVGPSLASPSLQLLWVNHIPRFSRRDSNWGH